MRTIWILPGWFGFIIGSLPSGSEQTDFGQMVKAAVFGAFSMVRKWHRRWQQRVQLSDLPDHMLKDMGIDPLDARREWMKPFWEK